MQRLLFESSPLYILVCVAAGAGYAYLLYQAKHPWSKRVNYILSAARAILVTILALLLIGPILKLTENIFEKPTFVILADNSLSVKQVLDSTHRQQLSEDILLLRENLLDDGFEVQVTDFDQNNNGQLRFTHPSSDISGAIRDLTSTYEGKNLAGIVLVSDGIYNSGSSPLYNPTRIPVYTVGVGDTLERIDLVVKNLAYNKIAYQGNRFPLRAQVMLKGATAKEISVSVFQSGKKIGAQKINSENRQLIDFDFQLDAKEKGLQRIDVVVGELPEEFNKRNNRASAYVDVVEGKKNILLVAPAPHPDIKVLRSVIEKNSNYALSIHIPGVKEATSTELSNPDLVIFHQVADVANKTSALLSKFGKSNTALFLIVGSKTNLRLLAPSGVPLAFENTGQWDEALPVVNQEYRDFGFNENDNPIFARYPPVMVPFGKFSTPPNAPALLYQKIGSVATNRPMLVTYEDNSRKAGILIGEGIWKWRLTEYAETEKTEAFDEVFGKLIQYLSTREDKRKFRCFPLQNEFTDAETVVFESQVYNDLFEQVYGNTIELELQDDQGKVTRYSYGTGPGSSRYRMGSLPEGVYRYRAATLINSKREEVRGEFLVAAQNIEAQNLTADFNLLRKLAANTGGKFYSNNQLQQITEDLKGREIKSMIHSDESFNSLINLKWVFFLLLTLASAEWFFRKYLGAY